MSFVEQDDIISLFEEMAKHLFKEVRGYDLGDAPFLRLPWSEAMRRFGSDKPDMRFGMEFVELMDVLKNTGSFGVFNEAEYIGAGRTCFCRGVPNGYPFPDATRKVACAFSWRCRQRESTANRRVLPTSCRPRP